MVSKEQVKQNIRRDLHKCFSISEEKFGENFATWIDFSFDVDEEGNISRSEKDPDSFRQISFRHPLPVSLSDDRTDLKPLDPSAFGLEEAIDPYSLEVLTINPLTDQAYKVVQLLNNPGKLKAKMMFRAICSKLKF